MEWLAALIGVVSGLYAAYRFIVRQYRKRKISAKKNEIYSLVGRFIALFKNHDIERTQIPRFLGNGNILTLTDISTHEKLLSRLDEPILSSVCELFCVQREWLDTGDVPIYYPYSFYKDMNGYIDFLSELINKYEDVKGFTIKSPKNKLKKNGKRLPIVLLFQVCIGEIENNPIYKYFITDDEWDWSYYRTRIQLKAMIWAAYRCKIFMAGCVLPQKDINNLLAGKVFPGPLLKDLSWVSWHPVDYIFTSNKNQPAVDGKEALMTREYMADTGWIQKLESILKTAGS